MITDRIHIETGTGGVARVCVTRLMRMTAAEYGALGSPSDDTLYVIVPEGEQPDRFVEGIYQGGNAIYVRNLSGFELYYDPFLSQPFMTSDGALFDAMDREVFVREA